MTKEQYKEKLLVLINYYEQIGCYVLAEKIKKIISTLCLALLLTACAEEVVYDASPAGEPCVLLASGATQSLYGCTINNKKCYKLQHDNFSEYSCEGDKGYIELPYDF